MSCDLYISDVKLSCWFQVEPLPFNNFEGSRMMYSIELLIFLHFLAQMLVIIVKKIQTNATKVPVGYL